MDPATLELIDRALAEDVGPGDVTTEATVAADVRGRATITQKADGVIYGLDVAEAVFRRLDPAARVARPGPEGEWREKGAPGVGPEGEWRAAAAPVLRVEGEARALLTAERTALNFLGRLSGIATRTAQVVRAIEEAGGGARILDTRKTTPGLRALEKAAVKAGGGVNHRFGLWDAVLIKDNHIALAGGVGEAVQRALAGGVADAVKRAQGSELPIEVEVRNPQEIEEALQAGATALLLDNMSPDEVRAAVAQVNGRATLEVSGGITDETVLVYATIEGVDYVSMGALTHSAPVLDLSLALETLP
jgi:nicotinate-nucleotide pyrophosphorylase (carboxylating)